MTKRSEEVRRRKEKLNEEIKATQLKEEKAKKKEETARLQAEEEAEALREAKRSAKVLERKTEEEGRMQVEEEEQEMGENVTAANTTGEGTPRKKARKARKVLRREKLGNKQEQEAKKMTASATTGATAPSALSSPVEVRKTNTKFSPRQLKFQDHKYLYTREFTTASCVLSQEEKYSEFTKKVRSLLAEGQKVDNFFQLKQ